MTAVHQLESTLRSLKLGGMLDTLEVRLVQARAGELGHQEFLQVLCEDELNRRAATAVTRRVRAAQFEEQLSLEDFDFTVSAKLPVSAIRDLATLRFLDRLCCSRRSPSATCRRCASWTPPNWLDD